MKKIALLLFSSFLVTSIFAQERGKKLYVWNPAGVEIFSERDFESEIVSVIEYGEDLYVEDTYDEIKVKPTISKQKNIELDKKTYWLKVKANGKTGYILGDRVSSKIPIRKTNSGFEYPEKYFKREFGLRDSVRSLVPIELEGITYYQKRDSLVFQNNDRSVITVFDGCTDWVHTLKGWAFFEVYNLLYNSIYEEYDSIDGVIRIGIDLEQIDGIFYSFGDGEFLQDAYIKEKENGDFEIGYYYCD